MPGSSQAQDRGGHCGPVEGGTFFVFRREKVTREKEVEVVLVAKGDGGVSADSVEGVLYQERAVPEKRVSVNRTDANPKEHRFPKSLVG